MVFERGGTRLKNYIKTGINEEEARDIIKQILIALNYIHTEGFMHRDIESENILINKTTKLIKIIDFGYVRQVTSFRSTYIGSFFYMAP